MKAGSAIVVIFMAFTFLAIGSGFFGNETMDLQERLTEAEQLIQQLQEQLSLQEQVKVQLSTELDKALWKIQEDAVTIQSLQDDLSRTQQALADTQRTAQEAEEARNTLEGLNADLTQRLNDQQVILTDQELAVQQAQERIIQMQGEIQVKQDRILELQQLLNQLLATGDPINTAMEPEVAPVSLPQSTPVVEPSLEALSPLSDWLGEQMTLGPTSGLVLLITLMLSIAARKGKHPHPVRQDLQAKSADEIVWVKMTRSDAKQHAQASRKRLA